MRCDVSITPFVKSSKWSTIDRYVVSLTPVGPAKFPSHVMTQRTRKTENVTAPATIWFFDRLEMKRPTDTKQPPNSTRPRYDVRIGFHSGRPYRNITPKWNSVTASIAP